MARPEMAAGILRRVLKNLGIDRKLIEEQAVVIWPRVAGPKISAQTQARSISRGCLLVEVSSSVWLTELVFLKPRILEKLKEQLGPDVVKDVRFRLKAGERGGG
jgi:predicted nucleic acid-binding Zn ribbon protein